MNTASAWRTQEPSYRGEKCTCCHIFSILFPLFLSLPLCICILPRLLVLRVAHIAIQNLKASFSLVFAICLLTYFPLSCAHSYRSFFRPFFWCDLDAFKWHCHAGFKVCFSCMMDSGMMRDAERLQGLWQCANGSMSTPQRLPKP